MNLPQGYKQTELGIIPEDWEIVNLGSIAKINGRIGFRGYTVADLVPKGFGAITLSPSNIIDNQIDYTDCTYISWYKYDESPEIKVNNGDILLVKTGSTFGKSALVNNLPEKATINPQFVLLNNIKCDNKYLSYIIKHDIIQNQIHSDIVGGAIPTLSQEKISKFILFHPPLPEQKAIAEALSDVDELITALDKKIAKKRLIKQGAMQELLTGKKRLPGFEEEWEKKTIEDLGELTGSGVDKKFKEDEHFVRLVNYLDVFRRDYIYDKELDFWTTANDLKKEQCNVLQGDVFFTPSSEMPFDIAISAVAMNDMKDVCYSYHIYRLRFHIDIDLCFKAYMFKSQFFYDQANVACEGSGKRYVISLSKFKKLKVYYPTNIQEQQAIATILSNMDKEIAELEAQRDKYRLVKSGMMQKLLTGEIRMKIIQNKCKI